MLISIALIFLGGLLLGRIAEGIKLPRLIGMLIAGILLGPYVCDLLDQSILNISGELRQIALIMILLRAGLSLDVQELKQVGRPAFLLCFLPACLEITGMVLFAPGLLHISVVEAALLGTVIAAVSPAVIVPGMLKLMEEGYGTAKGIPQMLLAGASVDDVFVIVLFTAFTGIVQGERVSAGYFLTIPVSIIAGIILGGMVGMAVSWLFKHCEIRSAVRVMVVISAAFLLVGLEAVAENIMPVSGLLAVMSMGIVVQRREKRRAAGMTAALRELWVAAEVVLFVLVGAAVDIRYAVAAGGSVIILLILVLVCRSLGVLLCMAGTKLNYRERLFCILAYMPKATVQAAIGSVPLAMGMAAGNVILTVAVLAIILTAPVGAIAIEKSYQKLLEKS